MRWVKKVVSGFVAMSMIISVSSAFAEIPENTVIIDGKAYSWDYLTDENIEKINSNLSGDEEIIIRTSHGWYSVNGDDFDNVESIPNVIYTDKEGSVYEYREQNGERVVGEVIASGIVDKKTVKIFVNQNVDKQWLKEKQNLVIGNKVLSEKDEVYFDEQEKAIVIKLDQEIDNQKPTDIKLNNLKNEYGEVISASFTEKVVAVENQEDIEKLGEFSGTVSVIGKADVSLKNISGKVFVAASNVKISDYQGKDNVILSKESESVELNNFKCRNLVAFNKNTIVKNGEVNELILSNDDKEVAKVVINQVVAEQVRINGNTELKNSDGSIESVKILKESKVDLEGTFETIEVLKNSTVVVKGKSAIKQGINVFASSEITGDEEAMISNVNIKKKNTEIKVSGKIEKLNINEDAKVKLENAEIALLEVNSEKPEVDIDAKSTIEKVEDGGNDYAGKDKVDEQVTGNDEEPAQKPSENEENIAFRGHKVNNFSSYVFQLKTQITNYSELNDISNVIKLYLNDKEIEGDFTATLKDNGNEIEVKFYAAQLVEKNFVIKKDDVITLKYSKKLDATIPTWKNQSGLISDFAEKFVVKEELLASEDIKLKNVEDSFFGEIKEATKKIVLYSSSQMTGSEVLQNIMSNISFENFELARLSEDKDGNVKLNLYGQDGSSLVFDIVKDEMNFIAEYESTSVAVGKVKEINLENNKELQYQVEYDESKISVEKQIDKLVVTGKEIGESVIKITAQAVRTDGSLIEGKIFNHTIKISAVENPEVEMTQVNAYGYDELQISFDKNLEDKYEVEELFKLKINDEEVEVLGAEVVSNKLYVRFDNEYVKGWIKGDITYKLAVGTKIELEYEKSESKAIMFNGVEIDPFTQSLDIEEEPKGLDGAVIEISNPKFFGEIYNDESKISIFELMDPDDVMKSIRATESSKLYYVGGRPFSTKKVAVIAPNGDQKIYKLKSEPFEFGFRTNNTQILNVFDVETVKIENERNFEYEFVVDNQDIIQVRKFDNLLKVEALKKGTASITINATVTRNDGSVVEGKILSHTKAFDVQEVPVVSLTAKSLVEVKQNGEKQLYVTVNPSNATHKELTWESSDESIVTVNESGVVTGVSLGRAVITVTSVNGISTSVVVEVIPNELSMNIDNDNGRITLTVPAEYIGESSKVIVTINNAINGNLELIQEYELTSDNTEIEFKLDKGVYEGSINIVNSRRFTIKTFNVE